MQKIIVPSGNYTFDASAKTVTVSGTPYTTYFNEEYLLLITNITDNIIIYNFGCEGYGGTISGAVVTLEYDTTAMLDTDALQIILYNAGNEVNVNLQDGAATDLTSTLVGSDQALDVNVVQTVVVAGGNEVIQDTHDDLNTNANIQINDTDVSNSNPIPIGFSDSPIFDAFGRLRTSEPTNRLDLEFIYDDQPDLVDTITSGAGTASHQTNTRDVLLTVGSLVNGDSAELRSHPVPYTAGNSQLIDITGVLNYANVSGTVEIFLRTTISGTTSETTYAQTSWDNLTSGIDWQYSQIFAFDFQSLKVGRIRYGIVDSGTFTLVKEITNDNTRNSGYWQLPSLPLYWKVYNTATEQITELGYGDSSNGIGFRFTHAAVDNTDVSIMAICGTVKSEGGASLQELPGLARSISRGATPITISTSLIPMISIRPRSTFNSLSNLAIALPTGFNIQNTNAIFYQIIYGGTLTGAAFGNVDATHSIMEYDTTASAITGGRVVKEGVINTARNSEFNFENLLDRVVLWDRQDDVETGILTIASVRLSSNSVTYCGFDWKEIK